jgi:hypothetical protein
VTSVENTEKCFKTLTSSTKDGEEKWKWKWNSNVRQDANVQYYFIVSLSNSTLVFQAAKVRQSKRYKCAMEWFEIEVFVLNNALEWPFNPWTAFETLNCRSNSSSVFVISNQTLCEHVTLQNEFISPWPSLPLTLTQKHILRIAIELRGFIIARLFGKEKYYTN